MIEYNILNKISNIFIKKDDYIRIKIYLIKKNQKHLK